jgi:predicted DCC family thiol-disulfide oxidoreductase YuxK
LTRSTLPSAGDMPQVPTTDSRPTLVYDGDCGICRRWVAYWEALTGTQVAYRPYQQAARDYPQIPLDAFRHSIQLIEADGTVHSGAAATYRVLARVPGRRLWWWLYTHVPGFAPVSEWAYAFFARRRDLLSALTTLLWGRTLVPERYERVTGFFIRGLALVYFAAFASLAVQVLGLIGSRGILPVAPYLDALREQYGALEALDMPTLFWLGASDTLLFGGTIAGMALAVLVTLRKLERIALTGLFALYLSYVHAGQDFMMFQWDLLLLEAGFLAIFLPDGSRIVIWLFRWLAFRYLLMAGAAKLLSGDPTWRSLAALRYHFETQPLPTPLAWYAAQLPAWLLSIGTASALVTEVIVVFLIFAPRNPRMFAAWCVFGFELLILVTGNYNFFNLLTMLLCVFLFDDAALTRFGPGRWRMAIDAPLPALPGRARTALATIVALIVIPVGIDRIWHQFTHGLRVPVVQPFADAIAPLLIVNPYGLFAVMTTARPEIVIEGSNDAIDWREYELHYKPGTLVRRPPWNLPHQPRLDWEMWFAALGGSWTDPWFAGLLRRLLEGSPDVLALMMVNPFPDHPPRYIRAVIYDYRFADAATRAATGQWWVRRKTGDFSPALSLPDLQ